MCYRRVLFLFESYDMVIGIEVGEADIVIQCDNVFAEYEGRFGDVLFVCIVLGWQ